jgi:hypothetical protein
LNSNIAFLPGDSSILAWTRLGVARERALALFSAVETLGKQEDDQGTLL